MSDQPMRPYSIRVFVPSGDPDGVRLVERTNWTGVGIVFKRTGYSAVVIDDLRQEFVVASERDEIGTKDHLGSQKPCDDTPVSAAGAT